MKYYSPLLFTQEYKTYNDNLSNLCSNNTALQYIRMKSKHFNVQKLMLLHH